MPEDRSCLYLQSNVELPARSSLVASAETAGWRVRAISSVTSLFLCRVEKRRRIETVYGTGPFVARVARRLGLALIGPPQDWFRDVPEDLREKWLLLRSSGTRIAVGVREPVSWETRVLVLVLDGAVKSVALWVRGNPPPRSSTWLEFGCSRLPDPRDNPLTDLEEQDVRGFCVELLARPDVRLPPVFCMTVGMLSLSKRMLIEQLYPACCSPFVPQQAADLLPLLARSCKSKERLSAAERRWQLEYRGAFFHGRQSEIE